MQRPRVRVRRQSEMPVQLRRDSQESCELKLPSQFHSIQISSRRTVQPLIRITTEEIHPLRARRNGKQKENSQQKQQPSSHEKSPPKLELEFEIAALGKSRSAAGTGLVVFCDAGKAETVTPRNSVGVP